MSVGGRGVPVQVHHLDMKDRHERELTDKWILENSPIPGVDLGENPMDIRSRRDIAMIRQAARSRWPVTDAMKEKVLETMTQIMDKAEEPRDKIAAARLIMDADRLSLAEQTAQQKDGNTSPVQINIANAMPAMARLSDADLENEIRALDTTAAPSGS